MVNYLLLSLYVTFGIWSAIMALVLLVNQTKYDVGDGTCCVVCIVLTFTTIFFIRLGLGYW